MKKFLLSIFVISLMVGVYSCKKDINQQIPNQQQDNEMMKRGKKVVSIIRSFQEKMAGDLKSGGTISLDSAVWNMEASLNYDYAQPDSASKNFNIVNSLYTINIDANHMVLLDDMQTVYSLIEDTLLLQYNAIQDPIKIIVFSNVTLDSIQGTIAYLSVANGFGTNLYGTYIPFEEDDDWIWGSFYTDDLAGKCVGDEFYGISDGSNELEWRLNGLSSPTQPYFYTDIEEHQVDFYNCWYNEPPNLPRVFSTTNNDHCMNNTELTFYLAAADWIIYDYNDPSNDGSQIVIEDGEGARPAGKHFMRISIEDWVVDNSVEAHVYLITYGTRLYAPTD
jgi:hypothetical protein